METTQRSRGAGRASRSRPIGDNRCRLWPECKVTTWRLLLLALLSLNPSLRSQPSANTVAAVNPLRGNLPLTSYLLLRRLLNSDRSNHQQARKRRTSRYVENWLEKHVKKVYDKSDANHDSRISEQEAYEMILHMYIELNRRAPIPPPSRATVHDWFAKAEDTSKPGGSRKNGSLDLYEFHTLLRLLYRRAGIRLLAHKIVTIVGAPIVTELILHHVKRSPWCMHQIHHACDHYRLMHFVLPNRRLRSNVCSIQFIRTILIILFVTTLGNQFLHAIHCFFDVN
jgi:hypothetical protein